MKFYDMDGRLFVREGDAAAVWQSGEWRVLGLEVARKLRLWGEELTAEQAAARFPDADMEVIPSLSN